MRRSLLALVALLAGCGVAKAQVMQSGAITPQHLTMWAANNVALDAGGAARLAQGLQPFEIGIVAPPNGSGNPFPATASGGGPNGEIACLYDAPLGQAGHYLCFSPNLGSNTASIDFGSIGGGTVGSLQFIVNGTKIAIPGPGNGTVVGPISSTTGNVACWNNTVGSILADCGPGGLVTPLVPTQLTADNSTKAASTAFVKNQGYLTTSVVSFAPQGRLSLQSAVPIHNYNLGAGLSTIYYVDYAGALVPVWNGASNVLLTIGGGNISDAVPNSGAGVINANQVVDVFGVSVSGVLTLCHATNGSGGGWASDAGGGSNTSRGTGYTALTRAVTGYLNNTNSIANCYNGATNLGPILANQATYLGTVYTTGAGTFTWNVTGINTGGCSGTAAIVLGIWNYYNRVELNVACVDSGANYTYTSSVVRQARGSVGNQIQYVKGVIEDADSSYLTNRSIANGTNAATVVGIGFTSTTFVGPDLPCTTPTGLNVSIQCGVTPLLTQTPLGLTTVYSLEQGDGTNANIFDSGNVNTIGLIVKL